jgi:hypothetical protein
VAAGGAAVLLGLMAPHASAAGTGQEQITSPAANFTPAVDANGNPIDSIITLAGTGFTPGASVFAMICDGENPTTSGWSPQDDCDLGTQTAAAIVSATGTVQFGSSITGLTLDVFRGVSPSDDFNCLAPVDDPNGPAAAVTNAADQADVARIDANVPSWGGDSVGLSDGGFSACTIRVAYEPGTYEPTDQFVSINLAQNGTPAPPSDVPESPLTVALPVSGFLLFFGATRFLQRRRAATRP